MRMSLDNMVIQLAERKMLTIRDARDIRIECNEGIVWLTIEGQPGDFLLEKGEHLHIKNKGPAFIQGMPYGLVKLVSATSGPSSKAICLAFRFTPITHSCITFAAKDNHAYT